MALPEPESWKRMVLRSMPAPAWLGPDAPNGDVVLSSRTRLARNLVGFRFPHRADEKQLVTVMETILSAARHGLPDFEAHKGLTNAERDHLVGCRLVSPEFEWAEPGRALLMDAGRARSLMVNEEDHLRVQALSAGWSPATSDALAAHAVDALAERLEFARTASRGFLTASPINLGAGRRRSAMFHLIGIAHARRLGAVIRALGSEGIVVRGLFGESSRAIGAFVQVSVLSAPTTDFHGACEYLLQEERAARAAVPTPQVAEQAKRAQDFAISSRSMSLADALRVLAWLRWAAVADAVSHPGGHRAVDAALTTLELRTGHSEAETARHRANQLRAVLGA